MSYKEFIKGSLKSDPTLRQTNVTRKLAAERREIQQNLDIVNLDTSNTVVDTSISTPSNVLISGSVIGASSIGGATNFSTGSNFTGTGKNSKSFLGSTFSYIKK